MNRPSADAAPRCFVIDGGGIPPKSDGADVLIWSSYGAEPPAVSVPAFLEQHSERLRAKYLAFIHDLGESVVQGRRVVDHFRQRDGFSFWWMNRVAEKSPSKSARIFDCLRLLALEEILIERKATHVTLQSADRDLAEALTTLCGRMSVGFEWRRLSEGRSKASLRSTYDAMPQGVQGLLSFRHLLMRWKFTSLRPLGWASGPKARFFATYLFNLDAEAEARREFRSHQWGELPAQLNRLGLSSNWLHQFLPDGGRDVAASAELLRSFNKDAARQGTHAVLESYLSLSTLASIAGNWCGLIGLGWRLRGVRHAFTPKGSRASLWPLLRNDWRNSMSGTAAVTNCAYRVLVDAALRDVPQQPLGLFLFEGQGWETAFVHTWRKYAHGEVVGVPHSSMPFWYLSIYDDPRHYRRDGEKPLPDRWAVNGKHAADELAAAGLPEERMARVEALRFQHLARTNARPGSASKTLSVLLLGDFTRSQTLKMIDCLRSALPLIGRSVEVGIKRHPVCPLDAADTEAMKSEFIQAPLADVLGRFDMAFVSNTTSAGLDALLAGLPVIAFLDDAAFNQNPLRRVPGVRFVSTPRELASAIDALAGARVQTPVEDFFCVDESLPRWEALLRSPSPVHA